MMKFFYLQVFLYYIVYNTVLTTCLPNSEIILTEDMLINCPLLHLSFILFSGGSVYKDPDPSGKMRRLYWHTLHLFVNHEIKAQFIEEKKLLDQVKYVLAQFSYSKKKHL